MNSKMLLISGLLIIILAAAGAYLYLNSNKSGKLTKESAENLTRDKNTLRYVPYSKSAFDEASGSRRILFFYSIKSPLTGPVDEQIKRDVNKIPHDMTIIRVNFNDPETDQEEKNLAKKYKVNYQHTFVQIDENGEMIANWVGGGLEDLLTNAR